MNRKVLLILFLVALVTAVIIYTTRHNTNSRLTSEEVNDIALTAIGSAYVSIMFYETYKEGGEQAMQDKLSSGTLTINEETRKTFTFTNAVVLMGPRQGYPSLSIDGKVTVREFKTALNFLITGLTAGVVGTSFGAKISGTMVVTDTNITAYFNISKVTSRTVNVYFTMPMGVLGPPTEVTEGQIDEVDYLEEFQTALDTIQNLTNEQ